MVGAIISRLVVLVFGTIYPAYASYKAVKSANVRQYVHWMMYWVVFALFITAETFTDIFLSWLPLYYEIKIAFVLWLLSPYSRGSGFIYRKFIHPTLSNHESEIDQFISSAKSQSYNTMITVGTKGINLAASAMATAALKGHEVVSDRLRSYSMNDLSRLPDNTAIHPQPRLLNENYVQLSNQGLYQNQAMSRPPLPSAMPGTGMSYPQTVVDGGNLRSAMSMMDLSHPSDQAVVSSSGNFDTAPPVETADDMQLSTTSTFQRQSSPYATLPRSRKKKKEKSSTVRRSKRKTKPPASYDEDDVELSSQ